MKLSVFEGFSQDLVSELTGLTPSQVRSYREANVVSPKRTEQGFQYSFQDVLTLRLVKQLILNGVRPVNIRNASQYLGTIDPSRSLLHHKLFIRDDSREIVFFGTASGLKQDPINASKFGQLLLEGFMTVLPVGAQLEKVRMQILDFDKSLNRGLKQRKVVPLKAVLKKYGLN